MSIATSFRIAALALVSVAAAPTTATYTGVITDSMCGRSHAAMKAGPDDACTKACAGAGSTYKYALLDGDRLYILSDQQSPAPFAGKKVRVTGQLYTKTNVLKVDRIEAAR
jgi:hypothetical protein